jgi:hypothetical protein
VEQIPEGDVWQYELKLDGYRTIAVKRNERLICFRAMELRQFEVSLYGQALQKEDKDETKQTAVNPRDGLVIDGGQTVQ